MRAMPGAEASTAATMMLSADGPILAIRMT